MGVGMNKTNIFILGAGGHAEELRYYFHDHPNPTMLRSGITISPSVYLVSDKDSSKTVSKYQSEVKKGDFTIIGSGVMEIRKRMFNQVKGELISFKHMSAVVMSMNNFGGSGYGCCGCVFAPNCVVAPEVNISDHVLINYGATVGHNSDIGKLSVIGPNASVGGWCKIGSRTYVGAGASIKEKLKIGDDCIIAMGAVVISDVPDGYIAIGCPATVMSRDMWRLTYKKEIKV